MNPAPRKSDSHPFLRKLARFGRLSPAERAAVTGILQDQEEIEADRDIVSQGERLKNAVILEQGWAIRYRTLEDGRRQIMNFLLPGDMFDLCAFLLAKSDHSIGTIMPCVVHHVPVDAITRLFEKHPRLGAAMWKSGLQEEAMLRERVLSLGRRTAEERIAHILYELWLRLSAVGERDGKSFDLPITQVELADAVGLTSVHVSRTLRVLKRRGLVSIDRHRVTILRPRDEDAYGEFGHDHLHETPVRKAVTPPLAPA